MGIYDQGAIRRPRARTLQSESELDNEGGISDGREEQSMLNKRKRWAESDLSDDGEQLSKNHKRKRLPPSSTSSGLQRHKDSFGERKSQGELWQPPDPDLPLKAMEEWEGDEIPEITKILPAKFSVHSVTVKLFPANPERGAREYEFKTTEETVSKYITASLVIHCCLT